MVIVNVSMKWDSIPPSFTIEVEDGEFRGGTVMIGDGTLSGNHYRFTSSGEGKVTMRLEVSGPNTAVSIVEGGKTARFRLSDVPEGRALLTDGDRLAIWAEEDVWASL